MSSLPPPHLPNATPRVDPDAPPKFLAPVAKSVLLVCIVSALSWAVAALVAAPLSRAEWLQTLLHDEDLTWMPPALHWLGSHMVDFSVAMLLTSIAGIAASWGLLYRHRWALWLFIVLLVLTALSNFVGTWLFDDIFRHLLGFLPAESPTADMRELRMELQLQRLLFTSTMLLTSVAFAVLHGWLVVRLLRADVQAYFRR